DLAVAEDVGPQAATMEKVLDDPGPRQPLQVRARLAQLHARALDVSDAEPPADQVVQPYAAHHNLAARLGSGKPDLRQRLRLDRRERHAPRVLTKCRSPTRPLPASAVTESTGAIESLGPMLISSTCTTPSSGQIAHRPSDFRSARVGGRGSPLSCPVRDPGIARWAPAQPADR